jgi:hypothetical protein
MTQQTFNTLMHFTEKLTRDPDDRKELVLLAWKESLRIGNKASIPLMINHMKLRSLEINKRCALGAKISGKSTRDALNRGRVSLNAPCKEDNAFTLQDTLTSCSNSPLDLCIVNDFYESCTDLEKRVVDEKVAGFSDPEIRKQLGITYNSGFRFIVIPFFMP